MCNFDNEKCTYNFDISKLKTIDDYEKAHKEFWTFIAENHLSVKPKIPGVFASCFACHYNKPCTCRMCPIEDKYCFDADSLYEQWRCADHQDEMDRIALEIAEAKFKERG